MGSPHKAATRAWEKRHPKELKAQRDRYYKKHKLKVIAYQKEWVKKNGRKLLARQLKAQYGLPIEEFDRMLIAQNGLCPICSKQMTGWKEPCVDHDHETGANRDLLCSNCNKVLGFMRDSPELLEKARDYLLKHRKETSLATRGVHAVASNR